MSTATLLVVDVTHDNLDAFADYALYDAAEREDETRAAWALAALALCRWTWRQWKNGAMQRRIKKRRTTWTERLQRLLRMDCKEKLMFHSVDACVNK